MLYAYIAVCTYTYVEVKNMFKYKCDECEKTFLAGAGTIMECPHCHSPHGFVLVDTNPVQYPGSVVARTTQGGLD